MSNESDPDASGSVFLLKPGNYTICEGHNCPLPLGAVQVIPDRRSRHLFEQRVQGHPVAHLDSWLGAPAGTRALEPRGIKLTFSAVGTTNALRSRIPSLLSWRAISMRSGAHFVVELESTDHSRA